MSKEKIKMGRVNDFIEIDVSKVRVEGIEPDWQVTPRLYKGEAIFQGMTEVKGNDALSDLPKF